jgi:hypothetical protein
MNVSVFNECALYALRLCGIWRQEEHIAAAE